MARLSLPLLLVLLFSFLYISDTSAVGPSTSPTDFIKASCSATRYPALCVESLSSYANTIQQSPKQLAQTALSVSLTKARSTAAFVSKMVKAKGMKGREYGAVKDCLENMSDSVDRLSRSIGELGNMSRSSSRQSFMWHISNVQTWVSAALTDENTCLDGFQGQALDVNVKAEISGRVVNVAQVTSNALALVNRFATRNQA